MWDSETDGNHTETKPLMPNGMMGANVPATEQSVNELLKLYRFASDLTCLQTSA